MRCKKCLILCAVLIMLFITLFAFPCYAEEYGAVYPDYVSQSGGCFIECETSLGKGTIIVPVTYKEGYFGFSGTGYNVMNLSNASISGYFTLTDGSSYNITFSSFSTCQYRVQNGYYSYSDLSVTQIYNTNVQFTDEQGSRANSIADFGLFEICILTICLLTLFTLMILCFKTDG